MKLSVTMPGAPGTRPAKLKVKGPTSAVQPLIDKVNLDEPLRPPEMPAMPKASKPPRFRYQGLREK